MTTRLVVAFVGFAALVVAALVVPLGLNFQSGRNQELASSVERDAFVLASLSRQSVIRGGAGGRRAIEEIADRYQADTGARVVVTGAQGDLLFDSTPPVPGPRNFSSRPEIASALAGEVGRERRFSRTLDEEQQVVAVPVASEGRVFGAVRISFATASVRREVRDYWIRLALLSLVMLAASAAVGVVIARWATAPLSRLTHATAEFGRGDLTRRAPADDGPPEVRELAGSFNLMSSRIAELIENQDRFVADASHQLRTPLAALNLQLDNLALDTDDPRVATRVEGLIDETKRLSAVIDALLALARASAESPRFISEDVGEVARSRVRGLEPRARDAGVKLTSSAGSALVSVVEGALDQMLDNLIENAIAAAPTGGSVEVSSTGDDDRVELHVTDHGTGLSDDERERAFDRFWRGASESNGSGLGLAIVRRLAEAGGGTARLDAAPEGGTVATIVLRRPVDHG